MKKSHLNEYQNLIELKRIIIKYLNLNLPNFNKDTQLVVDYQEGVYLSWCPCHVEAVKVDFNWATFDYLDKNIALIKTVVSTVNELLVKIDSLLDELSYFEIRKEVL